MDEASTFVHIIPQCASRSNYIEMYDDAESVMGIYRNDNVKMLPRLRTQ
jgi:hypothetical protein